VVDTVHDTEEIVVKPLGRQLGALQVYAGATILGDGQIALILDPVVIARESGIEQREALAAQESAIAASSSSLIEVGQYLIVQLSNDTRAAVPLAAVKRLEEFSPREIEFVGGLSVIQYRGSILPLVDVGVTLRVARDRWSSGHVVVVGEGSRLVGLQVQSILDVSHDMSAVKPVHGKPGIQSYGVIQGKVISLLDVEYLIERGTNLSASDYVGEQATV